MRGLIFAIIFCTVVVNALEEKECSVSMTDILKNNALPEEKLTNIVSGIYELLRGALRLPPASIKQEVCYIY